MKCLFVNEIHTEGNSSDHLVIVLHWLFLVYYTLAFAIDFERWELIKFVSDFVIIDLENGDAFEVEFNWFWDLSNIKEKEWIDKIMKIPYKLLLMWERI